MAPFIIRNRGAGFKIVEAGTEKLPVSILNIDPSTVRLGKKINSLSNVMRSHIDDLSTPDLITVVAVNSPIISHPLMHIITILHAHNLAVYSWYLLTMSLVVNHSNKQRLAALSQLPYCSHKLVRTLFKTNTIAISESLVISNAYQF